LVTAPLWRGSAVRDEEYPLPEGSGKGPNGDLMGYGETPNGPFGTPKWGVLADPDPDDPGFEPD